MLDCKSTLLCWTAATGGKLELVGFLALHILCSFDLIANLINGLRRLLIGLSPDSLALGEET